MPKGSTCVLHSRQVAAGFGGENRGPQMLARSVFKGRALAEHGKLVPAPIQFHGVAVLRAANLGFDVILAAALDADAALAVVILAAPAADRAEAGFQLLREGHDV